ncbi:SMI1/KNR4 family protein [Streptomyces sp. LUP47B]|uniref:SMI1/KNR4 family protein n=1 Tax=Streptomyces sp. LUP47B TaxID=1890286 RepID=UPI00099F5C65|nr:SMI1/KNR4 family protein [Streptomyces sp. LUP47B]
MNERALSPAWLASWMTRVSGVLKLMADDFERRNGFPPGINQVQPADLDDQDAARALTRLGLVHPDLVVFYGSIGHVTWADVGIGYFIDPVCDVLLRFKEYGAVEVGPHQNTSGLVIGSNGGGLCYVAGLDGMVYRTRTATLDEPELAKVADDLRHFLELLEESLTRFVGDSAPGPL